MMDGDGAQILAERLLHGAGCWGKHYSSPQAVPVGCCTTGTPKCPPSNGAVAQPEGRSGERDGGFPREVAGWQVVQQRGASPAVAIVL